MCACVHIHSSVYIHYLRAFIRCSCVSLAVFVRWVESAMCCVCVYVHVWYADLQYVCDMLRGPMCVCEWVHRCMRVARLGQWANLPRHPSDPPCPSSCDWLSWMLMFCDGCGANKCFWHSTGSHYRSRPNGLASALMSRQVSQPQPLYQSHIMLMQGRISTPKCRAREKRTSAAVVWKPPYSSVFPKTVGLLKSRKVS